MLQHPAVAYLILVRSKLRMNSNRYDEVRRYADQFVAEFSKESDRASVIIAVAMLDQALEALLKARLEHSATN